MTALEALKQCTTVVADTGDFLAMEAFQPRDATTNPSLILKSVQKPEYRALLEQTVREDPGADTATLVDRLLVRFGVEILRRVPGRVSTEVDARLSFDTAATVARGQRLVDGYRAAGVDPQRVLIKVAATWEGIAAAQLLEQQGIRTNLTLVFAFCQAVACAQAKVRLISPFVGRITDWHKKQAGPAWDALAMSGENDPGVASVRRIYQYYKRWGIETEVMGASFRHTGQVLALAGCDLLTISPDLLAQLAASDGPVAPKLSLVEAKNLDIAPVSYHESGFRLALNEDAMATEKLAEGIRAFCADARSLDALIAQAQRGATPGH